MTGAIFQKNFQTFYLLLTNYKHNKSAQSIEPYITFSSDDHSKKKIFHSAAFAKNKMLLTFTKVVCFAIAISHYVYV